MLLFQLLERWVGGSQGSRRCHSRSAGIGALASTQWQLQGVGGSSALGSSAQQPFLQPQALPQHSLATFQQPFSSQFSHQSHSHPLSFTQQPVQPKPQFPTLTQPGALGFGSTNPSLSLGAFPGIPARFITAIIYIPPSFLGLLPGQDLQLCLTIRLRTPVLPCRWYRRGWTVGRAR